MKTLPRLLVVGLLAVLAAGSTVRAQAPTLNDIPAGAAESGLTDTHRTDIDKYVKHYVDSLVAAKTDGYNGFGTKGVMGQDAYAASMATHVGKALGGGIAADAPLARLKEVNLAIPVGRMGQLSIHPLVEAMISHKNPAVRYFGWRAYAELREPLLAAGDKGIAKMYAALVKGLKAETASQVICELMMMFRLPRDPEPGLEIAEDDYRTAQGKLFGILKGQWTALCLRVMEGEAAAAEGALHGFKALRVLYRASVAGADKKSVLQLVINMAWSAGKALDGALLVKASVEAGQGGDAAAAEHAVSANHLLLLACEEFLNTLTGKQGPGEWHIRRALGSGTDRGAAVQLGVLKWIDEVVRDHGLKRPKGLVVKAGPKPATQPATTAPATSP
jgi:hypothetical protein